jgi:predicted aldo/keto reductase-like oxidoreductase
MYCRSYGNRDAAVTEFKKLPAITRHKMASTDYSAAEQKCPQKMAIGRLMREAAEELG